MKLKTAKSRALEADLLKKALAWGSGDPFTLAAVAPARGTLYVAALYRLVECGLIEAVGTAKSPAYRLTVDGFVAAERGEIPADRPGALMRDYEVTVYSTGHEVTGRHRQYVESD